MTDVPPSNSTTLGDVKAWLTERLLKGVKCPACQQLARVYKRTVTSASARTLIAAVRRHGRDWFHMSTLESAIGNKSRGETAKLVYWGLIEKDPERRDDGGISSWFRVTENGRLFMQGSITVPKYALTYDAQLIRHEGPEISIRDALGNKFSYEELMRT